MLRDRRLYEVIPYEIHDYSTYASVYAPANIRKNDPADPNSRWSTTTNDHLQYITLRIPPSLVVTATFGKYSKMHVCNVKKMKISVSDNNAAYREVFYGGLRNDTDTETFNLQTMDDEFFVAQYVRIEPLAAWGINFNYSLWFVELRGLSQVDRFVAHNEKIAFRRSVQTCVRFLRGNGFEDMCERLENRLEHVGNDVSRKLRDLLREHRYEEAEDVLGALDSAVFQKHIDDAPYTFLWTEVPRRDVWPCERGGHQMVAMDSRLYLYGGWNGAEELEDFWMFDGEWRQIKTGMRTPGRRSCHRMVAHMSRLYMMGKYVPLSSRKLLSGRSDIWCYDGDWQVINPESNGGPGNIYDHQMTVVGSRICIFGGKSTEKEDTYAGLYMYSLGEECEDSTAAAANEACDALSRRMQELGLDDRERSMDVEDRWRIVRLDAVQPADTPALRSRLGHTMLHIPHDCVPGSMYNNSLAIIGGQRNKDSVREIAFYSLETDTVFQNVPFPIKGDGKMVQRSALYLGEIIVVFCHGREKEGKLETTDVYTFSLARGMWTKAVERGVSGTRAGARISPRSAHQFVEMDGSFYLFGGNVSEKTERRVNDFWTFRLQKKSPEDMRHLARFLARKHRYLHLLEEDEERAVEYLRTSLLEMAVDEDTQRMFEELCSEVYRRRMHGDAADDICRLVGA